MGISPYQNRPLGGLPAAKLCRMHLLRIMHDIACAGQLSISGSIVYQTAGGWYVN